MQVKIEKWKNKKKMEKTWKKKLPDKVVNRRKMRDFHFDVAGDDVVDLTVVQKPS